ETDVVAVASGPHTLAIKASDGSVRAWGLGTRGQLGNGSGMSSLAPVSVSDLAGVVAVAGSAGFFSLAVRSDETAWAWGANQVGQLGDGTAADRLTPIPVKDPADATGFLTGVRAMAAGGNHALALLANGTVRTWGQNNFGQLGDGTTVNRSLPVGVAGLADVIAIAGGGTHSLALMSDRTVRAWGQNTFGQLGDGTTQNRRVPVAVAGLANVTAIAAGGNHSLALMSDGTVWGWGFNASGQLGDGTFEPRSSPVQVGGTTGLLTGVVQISAGGLHSLALMADGTVRAWGSHDSGQIGDGTDPNTMTPVKVRFPE
ncbi:MAG: RCC1 repeat-containing protein, partial [Acidobacteria bacterium]|nr:RCC1 repeat-containing protein [Acidobacteriota bacterium]